MRLDETPERKLDRIIYIAAMNFKAEGGGVPMAPKADATDGKLSICSVHGIPKWRTFLCLPFLVAAKHTGIRGFDIDDCGTCEVRLKDPMVLHADQAGVELGHYVGPKSGPRCPPAQSHRPARAGPWRRTESPPSRSRPVSPVSVSSAA